MVRKEHSEACASDGHSRNQRDIVMKDAALSQQVRFMLARISPAIWLTHTHNSILLHSVYDNILFKAGRATNLPR